MAHIGYYHASLAAHEVVISQIGRQIEVGLRGESIANERAAGARTYGHATYAAAWRYAVVAYGTHRECLLYASQEICGILLLYKLAYGAEACRRVGGKWLQHRNAAKAYLLGQMPAHAVRRAVEIGMAGVQSDAAAYGALDAALDVGGRVEALHGVEDYGVVRYYDVASVSLGLVEHLLGNVYGQQRMVHLLLVSPDDQPRVVV